MYRYRTIHVPPLWRKACRLCRSFATKSNDSRIAIGDVKFDAAPLGSGRHDLIPQLTIEHQPPPSTIADLRWILQKDLGLQQDFLLLGPPALARDRRALLFYYAALLDREVEYLSLSRDVSDADLKQRKEVVNGQSIYQNQAPVRAALEGRLLILDGLEKAERNVLPTLNNLLENRELSLDDGSMLVSSNVYDQQEDAKVAIHRVHPDFRVAAMASMTRGSGSTLDPPLRSRFQARVASTYSAGELLQAVATVCPELDNIRLKELVQMAASIWEGMPVASVLRAAEFLVRHSTISVEAALNANGMGFIEADDLESADRSGTTGFSIASVFHTARDFVQQENKETEEKGFSSDGLESLSLEPRSPFFIETQTMKVVMALIAAGLEQNQAVAMVGPKGCGKSAIVNAAARRLEKSAELFSLFKDMTSRDLLLTRGTDEFGNTLWRKTPLTRAVENGTLVILDGVDKLSSDTLASIAMLVEQGQVDLPDGTRLVANPGFACIALAHPEGSPQWIMPEISGMFYWINTKPLPSAELETVLSGLYPDLAPVQLKKIVQLRDRLDSAVESGAADTVDEQESLVLSLRQMKHICRRAEREGSDLARLVRDALTTNFMPEREQSIVESCMADCGIHGNENQEKDELRWVQLDDELVSACRRTPTHPLLVPNPRFEENPGHAAVIQDILEAHSVGERALLIMGYQGVGKNRVVDFLLSRLQCEREYVQLHRDSTTQSLVASPSVEGGRLVYGDSPLVRAALNGRILVVDEADKAPVEVVALLKGLIEDGELPLLDGRILRYEESMPGSETVKIHPDFRIWCLANPAGYPFHGNDLAREMADVFSCHTVPAIDSHSQARILKSYGPDVPEQVITKIISIWQDLSKAHKKGVITYPFSVREAVSVVRHLAEFPDDGLLEACQNILAFDSFDDSLFKQLDSIFARHGVVLSSNWSRYNIKQTEGGISTPKTRTQAPKHGRDPDGLPHVGGNTWAGGSGGSDTAGLGGRGGPYRLDSGHPVHQVSDEMKAEITEEAQRRAREMAEQALEEKLKDLKMGKLDWERYDSLRERVLPQIHQLQTHLKDIKRRKEERVWLKRQSTGELDDSRLVDALAGEKDIFKRRAMAVSSPHFQAQCSDPMTIKLVVDVSASMYRFNGYDGRLERLLEATLMMMEALHDDERFKLEIVGHNGSSAKIPLVATDTPTDPAMQLRILEEMIAHTQYTFAGDSTLEAIDSAISDAKEGDLIIVLSDANLKRYNILPRNVMVLLQRSDIHAHLLLVGTMGQEAFGLAEAIPNGRAQVCLDSQELPLLIKNIVASATK